MVIKFKAGANVWVDNGMGNDSKNNSNEKYMEVIPCRIFSWDQHSRWTTRNQYLKLKAGQL
jgi:hypothetical protein